jgi:hypothetical protein
MVEVIYRPKPPFRLGDDTTQMREHASLSDKFPSSNIGYWHGAVPMKGIEHKFGTVEIVPSNSRLLHRGESWRKLKSHSRSMR